MCICISVRGSAWKNQNHCRARREVNLGSCILKDCPNYLAIWWKGPAPFKGFITFYVATWHHDGKVPEDLLWLPGTLPDVWANVSEHRQLGTCPGQTLLLFFCVVHLQGCGQSEFCLHYSCWKVYRQGFFALTEQTNEMSFIPSNVCLTGSISECHKSCQLKVLQGNEDLQ